MNLNKACWFLIVSSFYLLLSGCSTVKTDNSETVGTTVSGKNKNSANRLAVSIRNFSTAVADSTESDIPSEIYDLEATLFSINLKQTLEQSDYWKSVRFIGEPDKRDQILVEGSIVYSGDDGLTIAVKISDNSGFIARKRRYESTLAPGSDQFQQISYSISKDLIEIEQELSEKQIKTLLSKSDEAYLQVLYPEPAKKNNSPTLEQSRHIDALKGYDNLILEAIDAQITRSIMTT